VISPSEQFAFRCSWVKEIPTLRYGLLRDPASAPGKGSPGPIPCAVWRRPASTTPPGPAVLPTRPGEESQNKPSSFTAASPRVTFLGTSDHFRRNSDAIGLIRSCDVIAKSMVVTFPRHCQLIILMKEHDIDLSALS
jgi:hypothetical protein